MFSVMETTWDPFIFLMFLIFVFWCVLKVWVVEEGKRYCPLLSFYSNILQRHGPSILKSVMFCCDFTGIGRMNKERKSLEDKIVACEG